ncbi:hypothetical protein Pmar_PMAR017682 [Perkinsus marinus ATCC 50983]|uniref:Uncharacterized protein n=1 Tax=Perkinsus marinus (strain ATCC 50983 / TXsc) TaxID=423536 RepID=C5L3P8_PERM5|nr:hypothetical protein Pmar_PMAR017682 [Perkinsus marinus ATCC 50983]EER08627.1 hypothetical protein Pmar_PMAR017682 [Perkinsus marinus ATCC 50983]|eukprot:XP_002776811.1 hypothetical protein Pmar_PMAR017682 [Perkinsus marinus ATCC 50983]
MLTESDTITRDAEEQLMKYKKKILELEETLSAIGSDRGRLINEVEEMRHRAELDREAMQDARARIETLEYDLGVAEDLVKGGEKREEKLRRRSRVSDQ